MVNVPKTHPLHDLATVTWSPLIGPFLVLLFLGLRLLNRPVNWLLSTIIDAFLFRLHQVRDVGAGKPFPSNRYWFPGGQGDAAKFLHGTFLHGKENSVKWESEYGPIYRIWSGPNPEVVLTRPEDIQQVFKDSDRHIKAVNITTGIY